MYYCPSVYFQENLDSEFHSEKLLNYENSFVLSLTMKTENSFRNEGIKMANSRNENCIRKTGARISTDPVCCIHMAEFSGKLKIMNF